ncbi:unnamed protein product, partial [Hapterophycus canaliculatus]
PSCSSSPSSSSPSSSSFFFCVESLQRIENILLKHGPARGPFLEGDELTLGDLTLAVSTYHMLSAFDIEKQWYVKHRLNAHGLFIVCFVL